MRAWTRLTSQPIIWGIYGVELTVCVWDGLGFRVYLQLYLALCVRLPDRRVRLAKLSRFPGQQQRNQGVQCKAVRHAAGRACRNTSSSLTDPAILQAEEVCYMRSGVLRT